MLYITFQKRYKHNHDEKKLRLGFFTEPIFSTFSLDSLEFTLWLDPDNGAVDYEIYTQKSFEPGILRLIKKNLTTDSVYFDIGTNIGQHAIFASYFCKHVYAFEPDNKLFNQFLKNIFKNHRYNITPYRYAVGKKQEERILYGNEINLGASSLIETHGKKKRCEVSVVVFDELVDRLQIERIDFIKIDVEGFEGDVLEGASKSITRFKPKIIVELSEHKHPYIPFFFQKLHSLQYSFFDLGETGEKNEEVSFEKILSLQRTNILCTPLKR